MTDSNLPAEGTATDTALSFDDGVDAINNLVNGSEKNPDEQVEAQNEAETEVDEPEQGEEAEVEAADADSEDAAEEADGPEVGSGGKFVSNDAKVTLNDGTVTTVEALKRGFMSQQSFTRSTQEVAQERKALAEHKEQIGQIAQSLAQQRDFILQAAQRFLPQPPDRSMMDSDPIGYMQAKADYDERMQVVNQLHYQKQSEQGRMTEEEQQSEQQRRASEAERLFEVMPELKNRKAYEKFWSDAVDAGAEYYRLSPEDLDEVRDHRFYLIMRDAMEYRKAQKLAPKVRQEIAAKPKLIAGGKRMDPKAKTSRETDARREQLRKTGSFEAGVELLKGFNL